MSAYGLEPGDQVELGIAPRAPGDGTIRGCCHAAGVLLESLGIDCEGGHAVEATWQAHHAEVEGPRGVDWVGLAATYLVKLSDEPALF